MEDRLKVLLYLVVGAIVCILGLVLMLAIKPAIALIYLALFVVGIVLILLSFCGFVYISEQK